MFYVTLYMMMCLTVTMMFEQCICLVSVMCFSDDDDVAFEWQSDVDYALYLHMYDCFI